jgi:hypothetical protein
MDEVIVAEAVSSPSTSSLGYSYVNIPAIQADAKQSFNDFHEHRHHHQPSKKMRMASNNGSAGFVARFLASAAGYHMGGRHGRV